MEAKRSILENGLQVWTTRNAERPLISTNVVVHAGSKNDFVDATGLAHYLEHMMFKGNAEIGALNWDLEKPLLDEISNLFETYRLTEDPEKRKEIYTNIDEISNRASQYVSIGEYDRLAKLIGCEGTNAYTSNDETVYHETCPSIHLEKWMYLKSVQFKQVVLRLFHTELEAVYQEYNTTLSSSATLVWDELFRLLFPHHPYGTQTTIGTPEHLKNPRPKRIMEFFEKYYVASNMAIICSGDVDHARVVELAQKYFGSYPTKLADAPIFPLYPVVPMVTSVSNLDFEETTLGWRIDKNDLDTMAIATVVIALLDEVATSRVMVNQQAQDIGVDTVEMENCFVVTASLRPNSEEQTLDDLDQLFFSLLQEKINLLKITAAITSIKVEMAYACRDIKARARMLVEAFIQGRPVDYYDQLMARIENVTVQEAQTFIDTYLDPKKVCIVHKVQGPPKDVQEVGAPAITPIPIPDHEQWSAFKAKLDAIPAGSLPSEPLFTILPVNPLEIMHVLCDDSLFNFSVIYSLGTDTLPYLDAALDVFTKLNTSKRSAMDVTQKYSELGATRSITVDPGLRRLKITVWGLFENIMATMFLLDEDILDRISDEEVWAKARQGLLSSHLDDMKNLYAIEASLNVYGKYGPQSQYRKTRAATIDMDPKRTCKAMLDTLSIAVQNPIAIFLEAPKVPFTPTMFGVMRRSHVSLTPYIAPCIIPKYNTWYLFDYKGLTQATINGFWPLDVPVFDTTTSILGDLWTEYFGRSILFKEIREVRGLAYYVAASCERSSWSHPPHYGTLSLKVQTDVLEKAMTVLDDLIESPPQDSALLFQCAQSIISNIQTHRDLHAQIFMRSLEQDRLKLSQPYLKSTLDLLQGKSAKELMKMFLNFHTTHVVGKPRTYTVIVDRSLVPDPKKGTWLSAEEIF